MSIFKSIETYRVEDDETGITINGPGIVTNIHGYYGAVYIDGRAAVSRTDMGKNTDFNIYLFNKSCKLRTTLSGDSNTYYVNCEIALFN